MSDISIIHDAAREVSSRGMKAFTFTIGGQSSGYWARTKAAIERVVTRLKLGRSGEAWGGAGVVTVGDKEVATANSRGHDKPARGKIVKAGEVTTSTVTTKSGKEKIRETRPGFIYELDGKASDKIVTSETEARQLCATHAFMTRNKLGRFAEAEAHFKDQFGKTCKIHCVPEFGHKVIAKDQDGGLWSVGFKAGINGDKIKFTAVVPAPPTK